MANLIRHKRGTGDPGSSDFSATAELLINTADGGLFTKTDGGSVVEIGSGGGGSGTPLRYLHVDGSGSQALGTSLATIDLSTTIATSDASDFSISSGQLTVVNAGTYYVSYSLDGDQSAGNNRAHIRLSQGIMASISILLLVELPFQAVFLVLVMWFLFITIAAAIKQLRRVVVLH